MEVYPSVYSVDGIFCWLLIKYVACRLSTKKTNNLVAHVPIVDSVVRVICIKGMHEYFCRKDFHIFVVSVLSYIFSYWIQQLLTTTKQKQMRMVVTASQHHEYVKIHHKYTIYNIILPKFFVFYHFQYHDSYRYTTLCVTFSILSNMFA